MIVEINGKRKRKRNYQTFKIKGKNRYELRMYSKGQRPVNIELEYGGKLATSAGTHFGSGDKIERYEVSYAKLPPNVKQQVVTAVTYIEANGTPMENDEPVFNY